MRPPIDRIEAELPAPSADWRARARQADATQAGHDALLADCPALHAVRVDPPPAPATPSLPLTLAAWNVERLKYVEATAALLARQRPDIVLLSEVDIGMARSGNRDTVRVLAECLGMGAAYAVEFVELGLGDARERAWHAHETNAAGLHGNACLTRFAIDRAVVLPLDDGGAWFRAGGQIDQRRVGGRQATGIRTRLGDGRALWTFAVHFESRHDAP